MVLNLEKCAAIKFFARKNDGSIRIIDINIPFSNQVKYL